MSFAKKPDGTLVVTVRITLKPGRDDELIDLVKSAPPRGMAMTIREAMRNGSVIQYEDPETVEVSFAGLGMEL